MATLTVSLSDTLKSHVDQRVAAGEFADAEDYVRELIRNDEARLGHQGPGIKPQLRQGSTID